MPNKSKNHSPLIKIALSEITGLGSVVSNGGPTFQRANYGIGGFKQLAKPMKNNPAKPEDQELYVGSLINFDVPSGQDSLGNPYTHSPGLLVASESLDDGDDNSLDNSVDAEEDEDDSDAIDVTEDMTSQPTVGQLARPRRLVPGNFDVSTGDEEPLDIAINDTVPFNNKTKGDEWYGTGPLAQNPEHKTRRGGLQQGFGELPAGEISSLFFDEPFNSNNWKSTRMADQGYSKGSISAGQLVRDTMDHQPNLYHEDPDVWITTLDSPDNVQTLPMRMNQLAKTKRFVPQAELPVDMKDNIRTPVIHMEKTNKQEDKSMMKKSAEMTKQSGGNAKKPTSGGVVTDKSKFVSGKELPKDEQKFVSLPNNNLDRSKEEGEELDSLTISGTSSNTKGDELQLVREMVERVLREQIISKRRNK